MKNIIILRMQVGEEMDAEITEQLRAAYPDIDGMSWSQDAMAALKLRELIAGMGYDVAQLRYAKPPFQDIQEVCDISKEGVKGMRVELGTTSWITSLCKSFLLFRNGCYGQHMNVELDDKLHRPNQSESAQIIQFPTKKE